jgi:hypothetical protein
MLTISDEELDPLQLSPVEFNWRGLRHMRTNFFFFDFIANNYEKNDNLKNVIVEKIQCLELK